MRWLIACLVLLFNVALVPAAPPAQAKARALALLTLEKSARERGPVWRDLAAANAFAAESGRKEIIHVGNPSSAVIDAYPGAVHVQVGIYAGSSQQRLVVPTDRDFYWQIDSPRAVDQLDGLRKIFAPQQTSGLISLDPPKVSSSSVYSSRFVASIASASC